MGEVLLSLVEGVSLLLLELDVVKLVLQERDFWTCMRLFDLLLLGFESGAVVHDDFVVVLHWRSLAALCPSLCLC